MEDVVSARGERTLEDVLSVPVGVQADVPYTIDTGMLNVEVEYFPAEGAKIMQAMQSLGFNTYADTIRYLTFVGLGYAAIATPEEADFYGRLIRRVLIPAISFLLGFGFEQYTH